MATIGDLELPKKYRDAVEQFVDALGRGLRDNLNSVVIYGSAVRGSFNSRTSDINVLVVLEVSTPEAHEVIADSIAGSSTMIEPLVLTRPGIERSFRAFAPKFDSIQRHYQVLHGVDPLADYQSDADLAKFLCEQAIRNLRLRSVQAYIHFRNDSDRYQAYLERSLPAVFTDLSEVLRLQDMEIPNGFAERIPMIAREYSVPDSGLSNLLDVSTHPRHLSQDEIARIHRFLFSLLDVAVARVSSL